MDGLATSLHSNITGRKRQSLTALVAAAPCAETALAAVRVLGCDALAPALLRREPLVREDQDTVREALRRLPAESENLVEVRLLSAVTEDVASQSAKPSPSGAAQSAITAWTHHAESDDWKGFCRSLAWLAPMAWPDTSASRLIEPLVHDRALDLGRGLARALLRRDFATAARLSRWAVLGSLNGAYIGFDAATVIRHLQLCGGAGPVTSLHTAIAQRLIAPAEAS